MLNICKYFYLIVVELSILKSYFFGIIEVEVVYYELYVGGVE